MTMIPAKKKFDTLLHIYRSREWSYRTHVEMIIFKIFNSLSTDEQKVFFSAVSDDLKICQTPKDASLIISVIPCDQWNKIHKISKRRIEKMLIEDVRSAEYDVEKKKCSSYPSTWIVNIIKNLSNKQELKNILIGKILNDDFNHNNFVAKFFINNNNLKDILDESSLDYFTTSVVRCLKAGNEFFKDAIIRHVLNDFDYAINKKLVAALECLTDEANPEVTLGNGTPFLGKFESAPNPAHYFYDDDELPF